MECTRKDFFSFIHCSHSEIALSELFRKNVSDFRGSYFATRGSFKRLLFFYFLDSVQLSSVQALSCVQLCDPMSRSTPGLPVYHQLPEFTQTHVHRVRDDIQPFHPLSSPSLPIFNLSLHEGLSNESVFCIRWPKYWSFSFSISPSNEYSGLISFRMDWLDLLAVQGTLKCLL